MLVLGDGPDQPDRRVGVLSVECLMDEEGARKSVETFPLVPRIQNNDAVPLPTSSRRPSGMKA